MKKYFIIGLIIIIIGAFVLGPLLNGSKSEETVEEVMPAKFKFQDNLATKWDEVVPIEIEINQDDIAQVELVYNDSVFQIWEAPRKEIKYAFNAGFFGLGTRKLDLLVRMKDGTRFIDNRMVRVLSDVEPEIWILNVVKSYPHNETNFTQGLEFNEGKLYEGTGQRGQSFVAQVDLSTGNVITQMGLDANYFGEGITIFKDKLYQLTWQEKKCFVYDKKTLQLVKDFDYNGEGWGLCNDGKSLIMSDGTERLTFRNPETFAIEKVVDVYSNKGPVTAINELEYVDGKIYANIWMTNKVIVIEPENGKVVAVMDGLELMKQGRAGGDVMNGIAYNPLTQTFFMTGKNWSKLFEVKIQKRSI
jgi:glutamine cyclotransferase